jgi:hypothetical protein
MTLTVTERAIIDLERQREAHMARAKNIEIDAQPRWEAGDLKLTPDYVEALSRPVRIEMVFDDPMKVREQIEVLMGYLSDAKVVTQQHEIGINRQRLRLRGVIKEAADALTIINGRTPAGRRRKAAQNIQD